ncbi:amidohydrolase family protein [Dactylosporangium fulvum]|uniref:Amidohydrolase family protein n=2 Tax=Dactylosporangium fulvum TaxID=53359 RepID=A0ABY5VRD2_9ACTN|nr:amidohydrolase family protein [Dactylosporangium fulvum]UWP80095.1 amidohydrolase family protein [Dactylosporangium fulvum]
MSERWRRHDEQFAGNPPHGASYYPRASPGAARVDAWPGDGKPPGSDLGFMQEHYLDRWNLGYGVLGPLLIGGKSYSRNPGYADALARATNDWVVQDWLDLDPRLRSSIVVPYEFPDLAAAEVRRVARDSRFVQVYLQIRTSMPLGNRAYWPLYEAAVEFGLPIGVHFGGSGGPAITGCGWPSYYLEDHVGNSQTFQSQLTSLICEGVFERYPELRFVLIEGGVGWLPTLAWRLDHAFEEFRDELGHVSRKPSELIAEHVWLTSQPIEEPADPASLTELLNLYPSVLNRLMFASDYPHWDFDAPDEVLHKLKLSPSAQDRFLRLNASELYRLAE